MKIHKKECRWNSCVKHLTSAYMWQTSMCDAPPTTSQRSTHHSWFKWEGTPVYRQWSNHWLSALLCDAARSTQDTGIHFNLFSLITADPCESGIRDRPMKCKGKFWTQRLNTQYIGICTPLSSGCNCPSCGAVGSPWAAAKGEKGHVIQEQSMLWSNSWGTWLMWTGPVTTHRVWGGQWHYYNLHRYWDKLMVYMARCKISAQITLRSPNNLHR